MHIQQTKSFGRRIKRLHKNERQALEAAVRALVAEPTAGEAKRGDFAGVRVYKFHAGSLLALLAYTLDEERDTLTLLAYGSHENFYRDLKRGQP